MQQTSNNMGERRKETPSSLIYAITILALIAVGLGIGFYRSYSKISVYERKIVEQGVQIDTLNNFIVEQNTLISQQKELIIDMGGSIRILQGGVLK